MLDALAYPHIYQLIIEYSDRQTLFTFLRVSSYSQKATLPILYHTIIDPLTPALPTASPLPILDGSAISPPSHSPSHPSLDQEAPKDERLQSRFQSFINSPQLEHSKVIVVRHPELWQQVLGKLPHYPAPMARGDETVTMIRVGRSHKGRSAGDGDKGSVKGEQEDGGQEAEVEGSESDTESSSSAEEDMSSSGEFKHIFDIANLIPSQRLILYVPESSGIDMHALTNAAIGHYTPPISTTALTLIFGSGNHIGDGGTAKPGRRGGFSLAEISLVPDRAGAFRYTHTPPATSAVGAVGKTEDEDLQVEIQKALVEAVPWLSLPRFAGKTDAQVAYWGLEGLKATEAGCAELLARSEHYVGYMAGLFSVRYGADAESGDEKDDEYGPSPGMNWLKNYFESEDNWVKEVWDET